MSKDNPFNLFILGLLGVALFFGIALSYKRNQDLKLETQKREFSEYRHSIFLEALERRDTISELDKNEIAENTLRYDQLKGQPQIIWGTIIPPEDTDIGTLLTMRAQGPSNRLNRTLADENMHFAFNKTEPGEHEITLFETSKCPGLRIENLSVIEGQPMPEMIIEIEQATIEVTVKDNDGNPVADAQITVGKSRGGSNSNLYTWRKGLSDSEGKFIAENLTDGNYVVSVYTKIKNGGISTIINKNEYKKIEITLSHDNY